VICTSTSAGFRKPWKLAAREAMDATVGSVEGRKAVEEVRPLEGVEKPESSVMMEEERRGVLGGS
jgi:hypothetical protein